MPFNNTNYRRRRALDAKPMVAKIIHSSSNPFHAATTEITTTVGPAIFIILGHVHKPFGGSSKYGEPGIILPQLLQQGSTAWITISTIELAGSAPASKAALAGGISIPSTHFE